MYQRSANWTCVLALTAAMSGTSAGQEVIGLIDGESSQQRFGQATTTVGDLDGDGFREYVVASPGAGGLAGRVEAFSGKSQTRLLLIDGTESGAELGFSIAGIGDVNADGFPDLIAGSPWSSVVGANNGRVEFRSGKDGSSLGFANGSAAGVFFGFAVAGAGDLNGDGKDDVIVGAPGIPSSATVISGASQSSLHKFNGAVASATGASVSGGKDTTGDGVPDLLVSAPTEAIFTPGVSGLGKVRLYSGSNYSQVLEQGPVVFSRFGDTALLIDDVDGDGNADVIASAGQSTSPMEVIRYRFDVFNGTNGQHKYGVGGSVFPKDDVGFALAQLEDVTGDGVVDIISGAPNHEPTNGNPVGAFRVYNGVTGEEYVKVVGGALGDQFGHGVANAGDLNEDGVTDVLVGAPLDDDAGVSAGRVFLYSLVDIPVPENSVILGDKIIGTTSLLTKAHRFPFVGLQGSTFKLKASGTGDGMAPRFTLKDDQDEVVQTWTIPTTASKIKLSTVLPYSGDYALEVDGANVTFGSYSVKTNRKLPNSAKDQKGKLKGLPSYQVFFDGLANGSASIRIKPVGGPAEFTLRLLAPSGGQIDISAITITQASGKVIIPSVVMPEVGRYTLEINDVIETKTLFKTNIKLFQPKGAATHVIDDD